MVNGENPSKETGPRAQRGRGPDARHHRAEARAAQRGECSRPGAVSVAPTGGAPSRWTPTALQIGPVYRVAFSGYNITMNDTPVATASDYPSALSVVQANR